MKHFPKIIMSIVIGILSNSCINGMRSSATQKLAAIGQKNVSLSLIKMSENFDEISKILPDEISITDLAKIWKITNAKLYETTYNVITTKSTEDAFSHTYLNELNLILNPWQNPITFDIDVKIVTPLYAFISKKNKDEPLLKHESFKHPSLRRTQKLLERKKSLMSLSDIVHLSDFATGLKQLHTKALELSDKKI